MNIEMYYKCINAFGRNLKMHYGVWLKTFSKLFLSFKHVVAQLGSINLRFFLQKCVHVKNESNKCKVTFGSYFYLILIVSAH